MSPLRHPALYQINTRVWLTELSPALGRPATLDDIPDAELDRVAAMGFDWIWLLSVWRTGPAGAAGVARQPRVAKEFEETLPDLREEDIAGSGFAITGYTVHPGLGGDAALARLRERLRERGPAADARLRPQPHRAWITPGWRSTPSTTSPEPRADLARAPQNYTRVRRTRGRLAAGAWPGPVLPGWPDTLQLDYSNPATQEAMIGELLRIAGQCDGVRCDMAMLVLPDVFERTWGRRAPPFWPQATQRVRERVPGFCFMAEVYWDLEWTMLQQGFDYAYDKRLYDRLREGHARPVREHLHAGLDYQSKLARFLENHDEPRAAATFAPGMHEAAAVITFLSPGLRFFHQGQFEGRRKRISPHLVRAPLEPRRRSAAAVLRASAGGAPPAGRARWPVAPARVRRRRGTATGRGSVSSPGPGGPDGQRRLVAVNYAGNQSQCYVRLPFPDLAGRAVRLKDLTGPASYDREGSDLVSRGLYLDMSPWGYHVFEMTAS